MGYNSPEGTEQRRGTIATIEMMSRQTAVNLGGLDGPALYADASLELIQANEAAVHLLGAAWQDAAESLAGQAVARAGLSDVHHCILAYGTQTGAARRFAVHQSRAEDGRRLMLIDEELLPTSVPSAKLEEILESISDCFFAIDGNGEFVFANTRAAEHLDSTREELLGRRLETFPLADSQFAEARSAAMLNKQQTTYDCRLPEQDRWIEVRAYPAGDGMVVYFSDITSRVKTHQELSHMALHDALTGLPNRVYFQEQLKKAVAKSNRGVPSALLFLDMDRFKIVNDTVGHAAGDGVIVEFAAIVAACAREEDTLARLGGDEFALLLENASLDEGLAVAERIHGAVRDHDFAAGGRLFSLGASIGLIPVFGSGAGGHAMALADTAMYEAKRLGGEQTCTMTPSPELARNAAAHEPQGEAL